MSLGGSLAGSLAGSFGASLAGDDAGEPTPLTILGSRLKWWASGDNVVLGTPPDVQTATDLTTGGRDVSQATASKRPDATTTAGGNAAMIGDGVDDALFITGAADTIWSAQDYGGLALVFQMPLGSTGTDALMGVENASNSTGAWLRMVAGGKMELNYMQYGGGSGYNYHIITHDSSYHVVLAYGDTGQMVYRVDGVEKAYGTEGRAANAVGNRISIFDRPGHGQIAAATIVDAFIFSDTAPITADDVTALEAYMNGKAQ